MKFNNAVLFDYDTLDWNSLLFKKMYYNLQDN